MEEDNKLVTIDELKDKVVNNWCDPEKLELLKNQMESLKKVRFNYYDEKVITFAVNDILNKLKWNNYEEFKNEVDVILSGKRIPFAIKTKDKNTGKFDFWLLRIFVNTLREPVYEVDQIQYNKKSVLLSKQFNDALRKYCKETLKNEVHFWCFSGDSNSERQLDFSKFSSYDKELLIKNGDNNIENLLMFQFKRKNQEVMLGANEQVF